ncbi:MAG: hypothetical protein KKF62_18195 [Bacteroidetes bacterium]|nr:hypothetical protein [Bacteroidota bacterium]MBU1115068.1 hypothetical protein [Bacteroidota bacterium]MBU1797170.1 hypothetical protein [Bacteroidota bacterium]
MIECKIDIENNLLLVFITSGMTKEDIANSIASVGPLVVQLKENFSIITDLSEYVSESLEQIAILNKVNLSIKQKVKVGKVVRIIGQSKTNLLNFSKMDKIFKMREIKYVASFKDAIKWLNS